MKQSHLLCLVALCAFGLVIPEISHASLESSLLGIKTKLTGVILPLLAVIGVCLSAMSFFSGHPNAKQHIFYAILGCIFSFGAEAIVNFIAQTVR